MKEKRMTLFYDSEFTSLSRDGKLISMAFVSEDNRTFYAEFNDYPQDDLNPWLRENVLSRLLYNSHETVIKKDGVSVLIKDNSENIRGEFFRWIEPLGPIEVFADCLAYDWVFFCDMFGSAMDIPESIYYIPFDLSTVLRCNGLDPDINRENFILKHVGEGGLKQIQDMAQGRHNALYDAYIIKIVMEILDKRE